MRTLPSKRTIYWGNAGVLFFNLKTLNNLAGSPGSSPGLSARFFDLFISVKVSYIMKQLINWGEWRMKEWKLWQKILIIGELCLLVYRIVDLTKTVKNLLKRWLTSYVVNWKRIWGCRLKSFFAIFERHWQEIELADVDWQQSHFGQRWSPCRRVLRRLRYLNAALTTR